MGSQLTFLQTIQYILGGNIVFRLENDSGYIHEREAAADLCAEQELTDAETPRSQCLITGEENVPIARIHKLLSGVTNANTTGCAVVSFNMDSVESYRKNRVTTPRFPKLPCFSTRLR